MQACRKLTIAHEDSGAVTRVLAVFCTGPIAQIIYTQANQTYVTGVSQHLGQPGGTGYQTIDSNFPGGYQYNRVAYVGVAIPSDVKTEDPAPEIRGTVLGNLVELLDNTGAVTATAWSDNPVLAMRHFMALPIDEGGMGIPASEFNDIVGFDTANYCDDTIQDSTNDQKIYLPSTLPSNLIVGTDYRRFQSTGVVGSDPTVDGPYFDYGSADNDTSVSPTAVTVKRFTLNLSIAQSEKKIDILYKKMLAAFRGYINYDKDGKICIRAERPVTNSTVASGAAVGNTTLTVADAAFGPSMLLLISPFTPQAEVRYASSVAGGAITLSSPLTYAHAAGDPVYRIAMAFDPSNIRSGAKVNYPLSDRQSNVNQVRVKYIDSPSGFESRTLQVNDYANQANTHKLAKFDYDGSGIDSFFQAWRIGQWQLAKYRDLGRFIEIPAGISASLLEIGDVIAASVPEFGLQCVPFEVIELGLSESDEVTVIGQLYDIEVYDDVAPQVTVSVPSLFTPVTPGGPGSTVVPGDVVMVDATISADPEGNAIIRAVYTPPAADTIFRGVHGWAEVPDQSYGPAYQVDVSPLDGAVLQGDRIDLGINYATLVDAAGHITIIFRTAIPMPSVGQPAQNWRIYLPSVGDAYDGHVKAANQASPTPNIVVLVSPPDTFPEGEEYAPLVGQQSVELETRPSQSGYEYRPIVTWSDPTAASSPTRIATFLGVDVVDNPYLGQVVAEPSGFGRYASGNSLARGTHHPVGPGVMRWVGDWTPVPPIRETHTVDVFSRGPGGTNLFSAGITPDCAYTTPDLDELRKNGGAGGGVQTKALADFLNFRASARYDRNGGGAFQLLVVPKFDFPDDDGLLDSGILIANAPAGSTFWNAIKIVEYGDGRSDDTVSLNIADAPKVAEVWTLRLVSRDVNGRAKYPAADLLGELATPPDLGTSPSFTLTIPAESEPLGTGTEFAPVLPEGSLSASLRFGLSVDGSEIFYIDVAISALPDPADDRFQGICPSVGYDGSTDYANFIKLGYTGKTDKTAPFGPFPIPAGSHTIELYGPSIDAAKRVNTIVPSITPGVLISQALRAQTTGMLDASRHNPAKLGNGVHVTGGKLQAQIDGTTLAFGSGGQIVAQVDGQTLLANSSGIYANIDGASIQVSGGAIKVRQVDLSLALSSTFNATEFTLSGGRFTVNGIDLRKALSAYVSSELSISSTSGLSFNSVSAAKLTAFTTSSNFVFAGTLAAGVGYFGAIVASQVASGSFIGISLTLTLNGVTTSINNISNGAGSYGIKLQNNSNLKTTYYTPDALSFYNTSGALSILTATDFALASGSLSFSVSAGSLLFVGSGPNSVFISKDGITITDSSGARSL